MKPVRSIRPWLLAACAAAGCTTTPSTQVLTGSVAATGAIAVRAVSADAVVTAAQLRSDGTFTLALPGNTQYRLEILTATGVKPIYAKAGSGYKDLQFKVCQPSDPYDMGTVGNGGMPDGGGQPCDPASDPTCKPPPPPPCDPMTDPNCAMPCDAAGSCPPGCDPTTDPTCKPPPPPDCDPSTGMACPPPPPDCSNGGPNCPPPKCDPASTDPTTACPQPCDPSTDGGCMPPPPPPCTDPADPTTCKDPCMDDPASCGCASTDPNCWPMPQPPPCDASGNCMPGDGGGMCPDHPPTDIGCDDPGSDAGMTTPTGTPGG